MHRKMLLTGLFVLVAGLATLSGCVQQAPEEQGSRAMEDTTGQTPASSGLALAYLVPGEQDYLQLARKNVTTGEELMFTNAPEGLADFSVSPDGSQIVYSEWNENGGADLWAIPAAGGAATLLVACPDSVCGRLAWSPENDGFVYERHGGAAGAQAPVLWRFDVQNESNEPLFGDDRRVTASASWSPDGQWFSYYSPGTGVTTVVHARDSRSFEAPNELGAPLVWDPDGASFRVFEVQKDGTPSIAKLVRYSLETGERQEAIDDLRIADQAAAWSPSGDWLAVTRRDWTGPYPSKTQIWLMRGDGSDAHPVLADDEVQYLSPVWSADGKLLLFQHYASDQSFVQPEVSILEVETGIVTPALPSAGQAVWLP